MKPLKAVTSHTILDFFEAKPQQRGKKRGYLIIRKNLFNGDKNFRISLL